MTYRFGRDPLYCHPTFHSKSCFASDKNEAGRTTLNRTTRSHLCGSDSSVVAANSSLGVPVPPSTSRSALPERSILLAVDQQLGPERSILLAVDQQLGEGAALRVASEIAARLVASNRQRCAGVPPKERAPQG
jgi:hypothetical protein